MAGALGAMLGRALTHIKSILEACGTLIRKWGKKPAIADEAEPRHLRAGDFVDIAPHRRHRVEWTTPDTATVWLAVFYPSDAPAD